MKSASVFTILLLCGLSGRGQTTNPDTYTLAVTYGRNTSTSDWLCTDSVFYNRYPNGDVYKAWLVYCDVTKYYHWSDYHYDYDTCGRLTASKFHGPKTDYSYSDYSYNQQGEVLSFTNTRQYNSATVTRKIELLSATYTGNILSNKLERHLLIPPNAIPAIKTFVRYTNTLDSAGRIATRQIETSTDSVNFLLDTAITIAYNSSGQPVDVVLDAGNKTRYSSIVWENWCPGFTNTTGTRFTYPCSTCQPVMREMELQSWDTTTNSFVPVYRKVFTTGAQNELIFTTETYNKYTAKWSVYERTTRFLNSNGDLSRVIYESAQLTNYTEAFVYVNGNLAEKYTTNGRG